MSTMEQTEARRTPFSARRLLFWIHICIGLSLGIPFALLGITGSILVYEQGIDEFFSPAPRATAVGKMRSPQAIIDAAFASGAGSVAQTLALPSERGAPAIVRLAGGARGQGQRPLVNQVYIDPVSLDVLDVRPAARAYWMGIVHDLHGSMLLGGRQGRPLVGWFGVGMLALGLSGIVLWWPRATWRGAYGVKKDARGWLFYRQLHGTAGITAWLLFIVLSFSGIVIAFPQTTTALVRTGMGLAQADSRPSVRAYRSCGSRRSKARSASMRIERSRSRSAPCRIRVSSTSCCRMRPSSRSASISCPRLRLKVRPR